MSKNPIFGTYEVVAIFDHQRVQKFKIPYCPLVPTITNILNNNFNEFTHSFGSPKFKATTAAQEQI